MLLLLSLAFSYLVESRVDTSKWLGSAYTPSGASNTMWWPWYDHYTAQIDRELSFASRHLKMNTLRMFLHPKVYEANSSGLMYNVDRFLTLASSHGFKSGLVLFDSCWNTDGSNVSQECVPRKGIHNGCWYEGPEEQDKTSLLRFKPYTDDVVGRFGNDTARVAWIEIYNEPRGPNETFVFALRDAAFGWATSLAPATPVISCWDDSNDTQILDHHEYDTTFHSTWLPALYANPLKGSVITEGGSRWYQPPFNGDYGSPLTVVNFLQALRLQEANGTLPFVPGAILNWELMVGNSNTRWHWGSPANASEPAIPWDGWLFPDGTPVSYSEAASLRRYITGVDDFLLHEKFLTTPPIVEDNDAFLTIPAGGIHTGVGKVPSHPFGTGAVYEASVWVEEGGSVALFIFANTTTTTVKSAGSTATHPFVQQSRGLSSPYPSFYRTHGKRRKPTGEMASLAAPTSPNTHQCAFGPEMHGVDVCGGGPPGYRNLDVGGSGNASAVCSQACCDWGECTAWIVRAMTGSDKNCTNTLCCWLKPNCSTTTPLPGAVSAFKGSPLPLPQVTTAYQVLLNTSDDRLTVTRVEQGKTVLLLGEFNLASLENGLVRGAWNMLRVVAGESEGGGVQLSVFFNPMFPETGFVGNASDAFRTPLNIAPRLVVLDANPLPSGDVGVGAGGMPANVDYLSVLPASVL